MPGVSTRKHYCSVCACSEADPCAMPNGKPCTWAKLDPPICTRCAQASLFEIPAFTAPSALDPADRNRAKGGGR